MLLCHLTAILILKIQTTLMKTIQIQVQFTETTTLDIQQSEDLRVLSEVPDSPYQNVQMLEEE